MSTRVVVFPFDLFGGGGSAAGAELLGDVIREMLDDTEAESRPTRQHAVAKHVRVEEERFDTPDAVTGWRDTGRTLVTNALKRGEFLLWLGGNHLSVLPVYDALEPDDLVIQFDAHLDCYDLHDTSDHLTHGNFLRHVAGRGPRVVNVGHRDLFLTPADVRKTFAAAIPAEIVFTQPDGVAASIRKYAAKAKRVWLDIDADVFDPAFAPGVCERLPFGLSPAQVWPLLLAGRSEKVVGMSVSEFAPGRDGQDATLNLLGWLVERLLLLQYEA